MDEYINELINLTQGMERNLEKTLGLNRMIAWSFGGAGKIEIDT